MDGLSDALIHGIGWQSAALARRELSSLELTRAYLARIETVDRELNAYVRVCAESAHEYAAAADLRAGRGERRGPLDGIPIAIKDNIDLAGAPSAAGMEARRDKIAARDATVVARLREVGAVILGKTNMDEGAMGGTTDNKFFGRTHHPLRQDYTPGGSSGGSAVAVAAGLCSAALGSDTLGSIRIPASYCGIVGLKPTFGLISTRGVLPLSFRLDHVGPLARSVEDVGLLLGALAGFDEESADSRAAPQASLDLPHRPAKGTRVGLLRNFDSVETDPQVREAFAAAIRRLEGLGCHVETVELTGYVPRDARRAALLCCESDAANTHGEILARTPERFSEGVRSMLDYGRKLAAPRLAAAQRYLDLVAFAMRKALSSVDVILSPTTPQPAFPFENKVPDTQGDMTALANIAGFPALSLPMGSSDAGLPLGLQMIGRPFAEQRLLDLGAAFMAAGGEPARRHPG
jgi:aspartyl-tRNA(Asn)/glutamyl-tRNA(Gln) amidotransferase subunit A